MINNNLNIITTDLSLASFLVLSYKLVQIKPVDSKRFEFIFDDNISIRKAIDGFYNNSVTVSPSDYFHSLKQLKSRIFSEKQNAESTGDN